MDAEPTRPARVAAVQMSSGADPGENLASAARLLRLAAARGASVALLPENFSLMARRDADRRAHAEVDGSGPVQAFLADTARELKLWIIAGSVPITGEAGGRLAQSCLVYGADGARKARYDKIHLFDVDLPERQESYRESTHMAPGDSTLVIDTPAGRLGLSICYDVRFPELYRRLVAAGAQWLVVPAAFTAPTGEAHWEPLLRAGDRESLLCRRRRPVRPARQRPAHLGAQPDHRLLGPHPGAVAGWRRGDHRRDRPAGAGRRAPQFPRTRAPARGAVPA